MQPRSLSLASLATGDIPLLAEVNFTAPTNATHVTFTFNGTYSTAFEDGLTFSKTVTATVAPGGPPYLITTTVNTTNAKPGDRLSVTVTGKNQQDQYRSVDVTDTLPTGALVAAGTRQMEMSLQTGQERQAYTYEVVIPDSYQERTFTISTQVFDKQSGERFSVDTTGVAVAQPNLPQVRNATNATNTTKTTTNHGRSRQKRLVPQPHGRHHQLLPKHLLSIP